MAAAAGPPSPATSASERRSSSISTSAGHGQRAKALLQLVDRGGLQLVGHGVGDQPSGADEDLLAHHEVVLAQRRAGGGEIDDRLDDAGQWGELDGALDLDDLRLAAGLLEVAGGGAGGLGGAPHYAG